MERPRSTSWQHAEEIIGELWAALHPEPEARQPVEALRERAAQLVADWVTSWRVGSGQMDRWVLNLDNLRDRIATALSEPEARHPEAALREARERIVLPALEAWSSQYPKQNNGLAPFEAWKALVDELCGRIVAEAARPPEPGEAPSGAPSMDYAAIRAVFSKAWPSVCAYNGIVVEVLAQAMVAALHPERSEAAE